MSKRCAAIARESSPVQRCPKQSGKSGNYSGNMHETKHARTQHEAINKTSLRNTLSRTTGHEAAQMRLESPTESKTSAGDQASNIKQHKLTHTHTQQKKKKQHDLSQASSSPAPRQNFRKRPKTSPARHGSRPSLVNRINAELLYQAFRGNSFNWPRPHKENRRAQEWMVGVRGAPHATTSSHPFSVPDTGKCPEPTSTTKSARRPLASTFARNASRHGRQTACWAIKRKPSTPARQPAR